MKKLRVLIADDDPLSLNLLKSCLASGGFEVTTVVDGASACEALYGNNADLCLLNWDLPKVSGLEVCQCIRSTELAHQPYLILLAKRSDTEHLREAFLAGADDFMVTPFDLQELYGRIFAVAKRTSQKQSLRLQMNRMDPLERYRRDLGYLHTARFSS